MNVLASRVFFLLLASSVLLPLAGCSDAGRDATEWSADPVLSRRLTQNFDAGPYRVRLPADFAMVDDPHERYQDAQRGTETYRWLPPESDGELLPPMLTLTIHPPDDASVDDRKRLDAVLNGFFSSMQSEWPRASRSTVEHGRLAGRPALRAEWNAPVDDELTVEGILFAFLDGDRAVSLTLLAAGEEAPAHLKLLEAAALSLSK